MPIYNYDSVNKFGETIKGRLSAQNEGQAIAQLKTMGLFVSEMKEVRFQALESFLKSEKKVTRGELSLIARQLSSMLGAGIPITRSIATLSIQIKNKTFANALKDIAQNVEAGMNLTDAFSAYPRIFDDMFISMIKAGELGGILEESFERLADQLEKEKKLKDSVKAATSYPKMVLMFALIVLIAMLFFLVPIFVGFIPSTDDIPGVTKIIFALSDAVRSKWYLFILGIIALIVVTKMIRASKGGKVFFDKIKFKIPGFGPLNEKSVIARFARTLATLIEGGIPIIQAVNSAGPTSGSLVIANAIAIASKRIEEGRKISDEFELANVFPPMFIHMVAVGEETGQLPLMLIRIASFYEDEVETLSKGLAAVIEPIMLVGVGLLVGGMLISLYLPIFSVVAG